MRVKRVIFLFLLSSNAALAGSVIHFPEEIQTYTSTECEQNQTCNLLRFSVRRHDYKVNFDEYTTPTFGTTAYFEYFTKSPAMLEEFALVNFIRGCQFYSRPRKDPQKDGVERIYSIANESFGQFVTYRFPEWRIDSIDTNPIYNNTPAEWGEGIATQHGPYRWNRIKGSFDKRTEVRLIEESPQENRLYVSDRPDVAFVSDDGSEAKNISVEFRTCIYRTRDIPRVTTPDNVDFAAPIACHEWRSSYIYDFEKKEFTHPESIDCGE